MTTTWDTVVAVTKRVAGGEVAAVVMVPAAQIEELIRVGKVKPGTRVNVATSGVGVAIRAGAPKVDTSTPDSVRNALLAARTIAYSAGPRMTAYIEPLAVGDPLTPMPLFLTPSTYVTVPLEETYLAAYCGVPRRWREVLAPP